MFQSSLCCYLAPHRGRARYCNAHVCLFVCLCVCLCVCVFVRVFAKFQSVISQQFLNRSLWNLAYILRMGTPWLTIIFRILYLEFWSMRYSFQDRPVSKFGPPIWNCDKSLVARRARSAISDCLVIIGILIYQNIWLDTKTSSYVHRFKNYSTCSSSTK